MNDTRKIAKAVARKFLATDMTAEMLDTIMEAGERDAVTNVFYRTSSDHAGSIALMKFLSKVAIKLGVARHVYVVGGAIRNFIIDHPIKDIDIVIDSVALKGKDSDWFATQLQKFIPVKSTLQTNQYGVAILTVNGPWQVEGVDLKGEVIEIANARKESYGGEEGKGYKPHMVEPATIEEDIYRREFTFNSLLWSLAELANGPDKAEIIDITGCGLKDLKDGIMKCPSDPNKTFSDDPTRLLRVVKFMAKYNFKIDPLVAKAVKTNASKLKQAPPSAISTLLVSILHSNQAKKTLDIMDSLGLMDVIAELIHDNKPFRQTLVNWSHRDATILFLFDMLDIGLPLSSRFSFLDKAQTEALRDVAIEMDHQEAWDFVDILKQPGKVLDTAAIMEEFGLQGRDMAKLTMDVRWLLLRDPELRDNPSKLTEKTRRLLK